MYFMTSLVILLITLLFFNVTDAATVGARSGPPAQDIHYGGPVGAHFPASNGAYRELDPSVPVLPVDTLMSTEVPLAICIVGAVDRIVGQGERVTTILSATTVQCLVATFHISGQGNTDEWVQGQPGGLVGLVTWGPIPTD